MFGNATDCFQAAMHLPSHSQEGQVSAVVRPPLPCSLVGNSRHEGGVQADGSISLLSACLRPGLWHLQLPVGRPGLHPHSTVVSAQVLHLEP